jgi:hypothetical protein
MAKHFHGENCSNELTRLLTLEIWLRQVFEPAFRPGIVSAEELSHLNHGAAGTAMPTPLGGADHDLHCDVQRQLDTAWARVLATEVHLVSVARAEIESLVRPGETFILVDDLQSEIAPLPDRPHLPFLERGGEYWGPPGDDETAIRELHRLRESGAAFIVFAWQAFWWLDYYGGFARHLRDTYCCELENERLIAFNLRRSAAAQARPAIGNAGAHFTSAPLLGD